MKDKCYYITTKVTDYKTWQGCLADCQSRSGDLVSIHSLDEVNFLLDLVRLKALIDFTNRAIKLCATSLQIKHAAPQLSSQAYWMGLSELYNDDFSWTDRSAVDFSYWSVGEPNDYGGSESCGQMFSYNGEFIHAIHN